MYDLIDMLIYLIYRDYEQVLLGSYERMCIITMYK